MVAQNTTIVNNGGTNCLGNPIISQGEENQDDDGSCFQVTEPGESPESPSATPFPTATSTSVPESTPTPSATATPNPDGEGPPLRPDTDSLVGPLDGTLAHNDDEFIEEQLLEVDVADLYVEATFFNPYSTDEGPWDYGFIFRNSEQDTYYVVFIDSTGTWWHWVGTSSNVASGTSDLVDTGEQGSNLLRVVASGDTGWLYINDELATTLDLSELTESGNVSAMTGFFSGDEIPGEATRFEGLTLWNLQNESTEPSPTPTPLPPATPTATPTPALTPSPGPQPNQPPVITLVGDNPLYVVQGCPFIDPGATATDAEDGDLTDSIKVEGSVNV
jgi:hypothetical protein